MTGIAYAQKLAAYAWGWPLLPRVWHLSLLRLWLRLRLCRGSLRDWQICSWGHGGDSVVFLLVAVVRLALSPVSWPDRRCAGRQVTTKRRGICGVREVQQPLATKLLLPPPLIRKQCSHSSCLKKVKPPSPIRRERGIEVWKVPTFIVLFEWWF